MCKIKFLSLSKNAISFGIWSEARSVHITSEAQYEFIRLLMAHFIHSYRHASHSFVYCKWAFYTGLTAENLRVYRAFFTRVYPKNLQFGREEFAATFTDRNLLPPRVKCTAVCAYDIAGIPEQQRELITTFRPLFQAFELDCREQSEEFVLFSDRLVQSELRVFELCAPCLWHVLVLVCVWLSFLLLLLCLLSRGSLPVAASGDSKSLTFAFARPPWPRYLVWSIMLSCGAAAIS